MMIAGTEIKPGTKEKILLKVTPELSLEVFCLCGAQNGPSLAVTAGVHGCEYVGPQTLWRLEQELDPKELRGNLILLPLANPSGFYAGAKRVVPEDGKNLNRAFPGEAEGSLSSQIAWVLEQTLYPAADFLVDLHSGDCDESLYPLVFFPTAGERQVNEGAREAAKVLSVPYRVASTSKNGLYSWAVQKGIPSLLIERGCLGRWTEEEVQASLEDVQALMRYLGILPEISEKQNSQQKEIRRAVYEESSCQGRWYPEVKAGNPVRKGDLIGRLVSQDRAWEQEIRAQFDGVVLYYTVALGVCQGSALAAYGEIS